MKNYQLLILLILFPIFGIGQEFVVNTPNGVIVRDSPNGKKVGKLFNGTKLTVEKKLAAFSVTDNGKIIDGNWVKVKIDPSNFEFNEDLNSSYNLDKLYLFDGFITSLEDYLNEKELIISKYSALKNYYLAKDYNVFALKGDFFGDGIQDDLFRMIDENGSVRIIILNHQQDGSKIYGLGGLKDPFSINDYDFGVLSKVPKGTTLWSNYDDDFRELKDVPKNELVKLNYDAIYVHNAEACGGGYIFWKNNKWNWLQQE